MTGLPLPSRGGQGIGALTGRDGRAWAMQGENSRTSKLTAAQVAEIRAVPVDGPEGVSHAELARRYGVGRDAVSRIRRGKQWSS